MVEKELFYGIAVALGMLCSCAARNSEDQSLYGETEGEESSGSGVDMQSEQRLELQWKTILEDSSREDIWCIGLAGLDSGDVVALLRNGSYSSPKDHRYVTLRKNGEFSSEKDIDIQGVAATRVVAIETDGNSVTIAGDGRRKPEAGRIGEWVRWVEVLDSKLESKWFWISEGSRTVEKVSSSLALGEQGKVALVGHDLNHEAYGDLDQVAAFTVLDKEGQMVLDQRYSSGLKTNDQGKVVYPDGSGGWILISVTAYVSLGKAGPYAWLSRVDSHGDEIWKRYLYDGGAEKALLNTAFSASRGEVSLFSIEDEYGRYDDFWWQDTFSLGGEHKPRLEMEERDVYSKYIVSDSNGDLYLFGIERTFSDNSALFVGKYGPSGELEWSSSTEYERDQLNLINISTVEMVDDRNFYVAIDVETENDETATWIGHFENVPAGM